MNKKELINYRKGIVLLLENACGYSNNDVLDRNKLSRILTRIANTKGLHVDIFCTEKFWEFGKYSEAPHVKVSDDFGFQLRVVKTIIKDSEEVYRVLYDHEDLMTDEERYLQYKLEAEGEQTMNDWANGFY